MITGVITPHAGLAVGQPRPVTIFAPEAATIGVALSAALGRRGWIADSATLTADLSPGPPPLILILEDDRGIPVSTLPLARLPPCVGVGTVRSHRWLIALAERGFPVLDQAGPLLTLVAGVDGALRGLATHRRPPPLVITRLRERVREHVALDRLTSSELTILLAMMDGNAASEIADVSHRSMNTVRTHIKTILAKLGVSSQLAAVSMAHRSWAVPDQESRRVMFTKFGDDVPAW